MKKPETIQIDNETYVVSPFPTTAGMRLLTDIVLILGEPIIQLAVSMGDGKKSLLEKEIKPETISAVMIGLQTRVKTETLDEIFKRVLANTYKNHTSVSCAEDYDNHFSGRYLHLFKVVFKSLQIQYGDFLSGLGGLANFAKAVTPK